MKRILIICSSLVAVIIISIVGFLIYSESKRLTIDEITNYKFSEYAYTDAKNKEYEKEIIDIYKNFTYLPFTDTSDLGNTVRVKYAFYDKNDELLFYITFVGNRNLIIVNVDGESRVYQGK